MTFTDGSQALYKTCLQSGFRRPFYAIKPSHKVSLTMDPASAAGLGVGVASLAFDAFDRSVIG